MMPDIQEIQRAARLLEQGKLVAFPTETVYGLGADASNPEAIAAIFTAKGRPSNHPIIVHVAHNADLTAGRVLFLLKPIYSSTHFGRGH